MSFIIHFTNESTKIVFLSKYLIIYFYTCTYCFQPKPAMASSPDFVSTCIKFIQNWNKKDFNKYVKNIQYDNAAVQQLI